MRDLFAGGTIADIVLGVMLVEGLVLYAFRRTGLSALDILFMLLPGAWLVVALRAALTDVEWPWIALALVLSFATHVCDVARRYARARA